MNQVLIGCALVIGWMTALSSCTTQTIPDAAMLEDYAEQMRRQAQPEYQLLSQQRADGTLTAAEYDAAKTRLDKRIQDESRDLAFARHNLAESERKSMGIPTPDRPVSMMAPNVMIGGGAAGGLGGASLYRPFTQQSQGGANQNFSTNSLPTFQNYNNAGSLYSQPGY